MAGVNLPLVMQEVEEEQRDCDIAKFDLSEEENDAIEHCQEEETEPEDESAFKKCVLSELPESSLELREFLDREEFDLASVSSSYSLSLVGGNFGQKRTVTFRMCPMDELNRIDEEDSSEQIVDRVDVPVRSPVVPVAPIAPVAPLVPVQFVQPVQAAEVDTEEDTPAQPGFQLNIPQLTFPDFGGLFNSFESIIPGLFGIEETEGNSAQPEPGTPLTNFFSMLLPGSGPNTDLNNCDSVKFDVSTEVFEAAKECKHADEYRECLRSNIPEDAGNDAFLSFAADEEYQIIGSSFFQSTLTQLDESIVKNSIYLRRCKLIEPETEEPSAETETERVSETEPKVIEEEPVEEEQSVAEDIPTVPEASEDPTPADSEAKAEEEIRKSSETVPEESSLVPETSPEDPAEEYAPAEDSEEEEGSAAPEDVPEKTATSEETPEETPEESPDAVEALEEDSGDVEEAGDEEAAVTEETAEEQAAVEETPKEDPTDDEEAPEESTGDAEVIPESTYGVAAEEPEDNDKAVESINADEPSEMIDADEEP